jgi:hypothetical protein
MLLPAEHAANTGWMRRHRERGDLAARAAVRRPHRAGRGRARVIRVTSGVALVVVLAVSFSRAASAAPRRSPFCAAVQAFNGNRPPSKAASVASLQQLAHASPTPARTALRRIARAVQRGDPSVVLAQAGGSHNPPGAAITAAGTATANRANHTCGVAVNFLAAVPTGISAQPVDPALWARTVCTSLTSWGQTLTDSGSTLLTPLSGVTTTLPEVRSELSKFLAVSILRTQELVNQLDAAGTPKTPNGNAFAAFLHDGVTQTQQAFVAAVPAAQALPNDPQGFQVEGQALVQKLDDAGRQVAALVQGAEARLPAPVLRRAFSAEPACTGIG